MLYRRSITYAVLLFFFQFWFLTLSSAQLNAEFTSDAIEGCSPLLIQFADNSTGNVTSWDWTLGSPDGSCNSGPTTTLQNPGRIFTQPGLYCICLTVSDGQGNSDTECKPQMIEVFGSPEVNFTADVLEGCEPLTVTFTDTSVPGSGSIISWQWDLNNTACMVQNGQQVTCTYTEMGSYDITLVIQDDNGCMDFVTFEDYITVSDQPIAGFDADVLGACDAPLTVNFSNTLTSTANVSYAWQFGDSDTSSDPNPSHTYTAEGSYDVNLITTNTITGCADTLLIPNYINIGNIVNFTYDPLNGCDDLTVNFTDMTAGTASNWQWDFGDGFGTSTNQNPTYTFTTPGCYFVTLSATGDNCSGVRTSLSCIEVFDQPTVSYTIMNPQNCDIPFTVNFTANSDVGTIWNWDFGDSLGTSNVQNPSYTYNDFGVFPVTLTVSTPDGCSATISSESVAIEPLDLAIQPSVIDGCTPLSVTFSETNNSASPIVDWQWNFGNLTTASGANPTIVYPDTGTYTVTLIVTNMTGCVDTTETIIEAGMSLPVDFMADPQLECAENEIAFTSITQGEIDQWLWEFGDGGTSGQPNPMYMYSDTGFFEVCLTIFNNGCVNSICKPDYIYILPPIAEFTPIFDCNDPFTVTFEDNSIGADTWFWQFDSTGDTLLTSTQQNPTFTYPATGTYSVSLLVTNDSTGCSFEAISDLVITDPEALFTISPDNGCAPLSLSINNNSIDAVSYVWSVPGVSIGGATDAIPTITFNNPGNYTGITLVVADVNGCLDSMVYTDNIFVSDIYPGFEFPISAGCNPLTVQFTDTSSSFQSVITDWSWDFGDGNISAEQNPTHTYITNGFKDVQLTVTNAQGCSDSILVTDAVLVSFPAPDFVVDTFACTNQILSFTNTSVVTNPAEYLWDFGDASSSTDMNPVHAYASEGVYSVCLTVTDLNGCVNMICRNNLITVADPVANFVADTLVASCPPLTVNFSDLSANAVEWLWDFGDGSAPVSGANPQHIYTEPGTFDVCLTITSPSGCTDMLCFPDYISLSGPVGSFDLVTPLIGCAPLDVTFYGTGTPIVNYTWDNGTGGIVFHNTTAPSDSATFTYNEAGTYFPVLVVEDAQGCQRTFPYPDPIVVHELDIEMAPEDTVLCEDLTIDFFSIIQSSLAPVNLYWEFPGGTPDSSLLANPTVSYSGPGSYDVILYADNGVCFDSIIRPDKIHIPEIPIADFTYSPPSGCNPQTVSFNDLSSVSGSTITDWVWDFGTGDSSFIQNPFYTYQDTGTYVITLTSFSDFGCENFISQSITIEPSPVAMAGEDQVICLGDVAELGASGGVSYSWSPSGSLSCSNCPDPMAMPSDTTDYVVTVTADNGCTDTDTVRVSVIPFPMPLVQVSQDTFVCSGTFVQLNVSSGTPNVSYFWDQSVPGLSCYNNCFNPFATPTETTTYIVTTLGEGGCFTVDSITVNVLDESMEIAGSDRSICKGGEVQLSVADGNNPVWTPSIALSCSNCPDPVVNPTSDQDYYVTVTTDMGCEINDTLTVFVIEIDSLNAGVDTSVCIGGDIQLSATGMGMIEWSPSASLDNPMSFTPFATPDTTTMYYVRFTNDECMVNDSVLVEVRTKAEVFTPDASLCAGDTIQLTATGFAENFSWTPADGLSSGNVQNPLAFPDETTEYSVVASIGSCEPDSASMTVTVFDLPEVETRGVISFFEGQEVEIEAEVNPPGNYTYLWSPGDFLNCVTCASTIAIPDTNILYTITVTDENGCSKTAALELKMQNDCTDNLVVVPNAFTPNNDGLNDILFVRGSTLSTISLFRVFDRWGNLMFESGNINTGWDGRYKGELVNPGVYVYYVEAPCAKDGSPIFKKGNVTVIR